MSIANPEARLAVIAYLCVLGSCIKTCSNGTVRGILGEGVSLSCISTSCELKKWRNDSMGDTSPFIKPSRRTSVNIEGDGYKLHIFNLSAYDAGSYSCWCNENNDAARSICSDSLELICQAKVVVNNASKLHNSSRTNSFPEVTIDANVMDKLKVKCPEGTVSTTNCYKVQRERESVQFTYNLKVLWRHNSCRITCQTKGKLFCSISFTINVSRNETPTHNPILSTGDVTVSPPVNEIALTTFSAENIARTQADTTMEVDEQKNNNLDPVTNKPASFSAMIVVVGILIFIVVVLIFVVGFYIFSTRFKFSSLSTKSANPPHSTDGNIPIGPTYATVNKSSNVFAKGNDHSIEPEFLNSDGFYSEVDDVRKEDSSTHKPNSQKAETSITNDYYSEVNTSKVKLKTMENGQETDSTMYSEVNKGEKQTRQKECTSSQQRSVDDPSVSNVPIYHVLEESIRSDDDTVDDASTSQVMYAVVDKDT